MKKYIVYLLLCIFFISIYFIVTSDLIFTGIVALVYILFFFGMYNTLRIKHETKMKRTYEAISFINNFIISLSVTNSVNSTYEAMKENASDELREQMSLIDHLDVEIKLEHLNKYFDLPLYGVFINIIKQYIENGTNILEISSLLIHDTRNLENRLHEFDLVSKRKERDFLLSWGFTFLILAVLQFALSSFVRDLKDTISYFPALILVYYLIFISVYYGFLNRIFDTKFIYKGETKHDEVKTKNRKTKFRFKIRNHSN